jgi:hypothetical protein
MAFDLAYEELDAYIQQICTGQKIVQLTNKDGEEVPVLFKYPSGTAIDIADIVYKQALKDAEKEDLPSSEEMEKMLRDRGIFTEKDEEEIEKIKSKIKGQEAVLAKTVRVPARRNRLIDNIQNFKDEISKILAKRDTHMSMTRERKAFESKYLYLLRLNSYSLEGELLWPTKDSFESEEDFFFRKKALVEYIIFSHGLSTEIIRFIARSNLWRIRYVTAVKTSDSLFGCPIKDYNVDQMTLLYWSHFYQSVYDMLSSDRPPDSVIEDDQALDAYMKDWHAEQNRESSAARSSSNKKYGQASAWDHAETLVMRSNPVHQDVEYSETLAEKGASKGGSSVDAAPMGREARKTGLDKAIQKSRRNKD